MSYEGILRSGFHREEFAAQIEQLKQFIDQTKTAGKEPDAIRLKMTRQMEEMQKNMDASPVFLLTYMLLDKEEIYLWSEQQPHDQKIRWMELYRGSEYDCREYSALFDMRQTSELDWLTGLLLSVKKGMEEDYQIVMGGISRLYPVQTHFTKKRDAIRQEEIREYIKEESEELRQGGRILLFLVLAEYFDIPVIKSGGWNMLEQLLWKGLQFDQNSRRQEKQIVSFKMKPYLDRVMAGLGVHPMSLRRCDPPAFALPGLEECKEADWIYLWERVHDMAECLCDDKKYYKRLKQSMDLADAEYLKLRIGDLQKENEQQAEMIARQRHREQKLLQQLDLMEKERLEYQRETERKADQGKGAETELIRLRDFVYELETDEAVSDNQLNLAVACLKEKKLMVIGGHVNWQQRMKELFPQWSFLNGFQTHFSVKNACSIDYFVVNTRMIKHKGYYRLLSECNSRQSVLYCNEVNIDKSIWQIYGQLIHR